MGITERGIPNDTYLATGQMMILLTRLRRYKKKTVSVGEKFCLFWHFEFEVSGYI